MKIALGGILHETNTFSTVPTRYDDFRRTDAEALGSILASAGFGQDSRQGSPSGGDPRCSVVPLFVAHATPSGRVTRLAFDRLLLELVDGIRDAMPLDGVLLELHGAMEVEEIGDGETAILETVRTLVGPEPMICTTLDLHANLAPAVARLSDIVLAYRTAPHRDVAETRLRGLHALLEALSDGCRPTTAVVKLPLLVAGEAAVTEVEPARSLFAALPGVDERPGVIASSILIGCAWTDSPHTSVGAVVSAYDRQSAEAAATELAERIWAVRDRFTIDSPTAELEEAVEQAIRAAARPVFISDSGDNTTAGAAGDLPTTLRYLVAHQVEGSLVAGIHDPASVAACFEAGAGSTVELTIGARLDSIHDDPYRCSATICRLDDATDGIPRRAMVRVGPTDLVLQTDRRPFTELRQFRSLGIDPQAYSMIFVKEGYLFPELRDYAKHHIMALTPGFGDQRLARLPFQRLKRPIHPLDEGVRWPDGVAL